MIYLHLFWVFFKIGLFGFGGGMAMISMIRMEVVDNYNWLSANEFTDLLAISQMTPGPISINTATFVGHTQAGILGSAIATFALCLPSILLMIAVLLLFFKHKDSPYVKKTMDFLLPVISGLIIAAAILMCDANSFATPISLLIFGFSLTAHYFYKVNPIVLIVISGVVGYISM
ncbi:MAG: chromate transporter [Bacteroidales bacterium]|nr:chromate transporter [Bacteroidales bacterium]